jgi:7-cyano-7-deazaguanine tRNA-ribosyltransferase
MLEIKIHDGPARLGKYGELNTPSIFWPNDSKILKDQPMPYDVPKTLAEWAVLQTIKNAEKSQKNGIAVVHGGKYLDLRLECAKKLDELGNRILMIANSEKLLKRPRDLVDIIVNIREAINPNSALYFPFVDMVFVPLLVYMGVDLFGCVPCDYYAYLNVMLTPTNKYDILEYQIFDLNFFELKKYNLSTMDFVMREIRENIKNGTLRNLVEQRCCASTEAMSALRILDKQYNTFLDKYTPLY